MNAQRACGRSALVIGILAATAMTAHSSPEVVSQDESNPEREGSGSRIVDRNGERSHGPPRARSLPFQSVGPHGGLNEANGVLELDGSAPRNGAADRNVRARTDGLRLVAGTDAVLRDAASS